MKKKIILLCLLLISATCFSQWNIIYHATGNDLYSVYFTSASTGYTVGGNGTILKTTNAGTTWSTLSSSTTIRLKSVYFPDTNTGYVVGDSGIILKTINAGNNWTILLSGTIKSLNSVYFTNANKGYAVGNEIILKTTDAGISWNASIIDSNYFQSVYFPNDSTGYIGGIFCKDSSGYILRSGIILKTTNAGSNWTTLTLGKVPPLYSVFFTDANTGYAVGGYYDFYCTILKTIDGGNSWIPQTSGTKQTLFSVYFLDSNTGYAVGGNNMGEIVLKTINGGNSWAQQLIYTCDPLLSVFFTDANTGYTVCPCEGVNGGLIFKTTNGGGNGIEENQFDKSEIFAYPNPASDNITIDTPQKSEIEILNLQGQIIRIIRTTEDQTTIDISTLARGMYFIKVTIDKEIITRKFIKE